MGADTQESTVKSRLPDSLTCMRKTFSLLNPHQIQLRYTMQLALGGKGIPEPLLSTGPPFPGHIQTPRRANSIPSPATDCGTHWPGASKLPLPGEH